MSNLKIHWFSATAWTILLHWKWQKLSFPLGGRSRVVRWENIFLSNPGAWGPSGSLVLQPDPKVCTEGALMAVGVLPPLTGSLAKNKKERSTLTWCTLRKKNNWQRYQTNWIIFLKNEPKKQTQNFLLYQILKIQLKETNVPFTFNMLLSKR